jgi:hypothetical protein
MLQPMVIKFLCPNGHPLSAPENLAGKAGKCPKCATAFVVPSPEEPDANGDASNSEVTSGSATTPTAGIGTGSGKSGIKTGELFVFLCPNGHKLNGPPSLKGKAGQCPHCGTRFRIPSDEDMAEDEAAEEAAVEPIRGGSSPANAFADMFGPRAEPEEGEEVVDAPVEDADPDIEPIPQGTHALGYIVGRLWDRRDDTTEIEIFLQEGEIMSPDFYSEILSTDQFGVFAMLEGDGNYAITVIPWATVRRVGMRKVENLSPKMFR